MSKKTILLAAGGTGGHLFPAFAVAEELIRRGHDVDLITDQRGDRYGTGFPAREIHQVPAATLRKRSLGGVASTGWTLSRGVLASLRVFKKIRPAVLAGFGGYPTIPPIVAARLRRVPVLLQEQNAVMGRANRLLARVASRIALTFEPTKGLPAAASGRAVLTGTPVRNAVIDWSARPYRDPGAEGLLELLVFGGSQGARFFSDTVPDALVRLPEDIRSRISVVQQAREEDLARVEAAYRDAGIKAEVATFFQNLPERMAAAHLVVARSGASTVAELAIMGRPAILVPLPHALDNDQLENATRAEANGAAWCKVQSDLSASRMAVEIEELFRDPGRLSSAAEAAKSMGRPDAVVRLADLIEELADRGGQR